MNFIFLNCDMFCFTNADRAGVIRMCFSYSGFTVCGSLPERELLQGRQDLKIEIYA